MCENNQSIMVIIHQLIFLIKSINHKQSLRTSCFRSTLCSHHRGEKVLHICDALCSISINTALSEKLRSVRTSCFRSTLCSHHRGEKVLHICDALCSISINTALSEKLRSAITGVIYNVSTKEALQVLWFWDALMNIGVAIISPHLSQGYCG